MHYYVLALSRLRHSIFRLKYFLHYSFRLEQGRDAVESCYNVVAASGPLSLEKRPVLLWDDFSCYCCRQPMSFPCLCVIFPAFFCSRLSFLYLVALP